MHRFTAVQHVIFEALAAGKRKWFSQVPYDADDDFVNGCMVSDSP